MIVIAGFIQKFGKMPRAVYESHSGKIIAALVVLIVTILPVYGAEDLLERSFEIDDYFNIKRARELSLSSDGEMIAYAVQSWSLEKNKAQRYIYVGRTVIGSNMELVDDIQDARDLTWRPGHQEVAFLSSREGTAQVFIYDVLSKTVRQFTDSDVAITRFHFAPNGDAIAYLTGCVTAEEPSLYDQFRSAEAGILIDPDKISVYNFVDPSSRIDIARIPCGSLWLSSEDSDAMQVEIDGHVKSVGWSSNSENLSVTYVDSLAAPVLGSHRRSSLAIYNIDKAELSILFRATPTSDSEPQRYYGGSQWMRSGDRLYVRRVTERDLWSRINEWQIVDLSIGNNDQKEEGVWYDMDYYGGDKVIPIDGDRFYLNKTHKAVRSLFQIGPSGLKLSDIVSGLKGSISFFQFSADLDTAAFVNESLSRPPEIFVWRRGQDLQQLTYLNHHIQKKLMPKAKEIVWRSRDGTSVHGWLLEPEKKELNDKLSWPLITFIHGGPGFAVIDEFAGYFPIWPYPFEVYALNGMAVFIPNYRGTKSFGDKFADPTSIDGEPVEDIVSGIEYLIQEGIVDPSRLAISGHSHGAWLGSLVMARTGIFKAGSFAEGTGNKVVNYYSMPRMLNLQVHDVIFGDSVYNRPERYVELSPDLQFSGLKTAVLFEAGSRSLAVNMLGYPKAAMTAGMPTEFIVYPKTGHNILLPKLQKDSAERNLDWFLRWLK